ncbi:MAG: hypothetical protein KW793_03670 [Candidatus Doudnabacteria bacterium]|nr:hypothetical protein [Candidatus Doudnabacteria bacterium]
MSEFERRKKSITNQVKGLCAHCSNGLSHKCKVQTIAEEIASLNGVPLIVNDRFTGLLLASRI